MEQRTRTMLFLRSYSFILRVPLKPEFPLHGGTFFRFFRADTGGSVKTAKIWSEVIRKPPQSMAEHSGL